MAQLSNLEFFTDPFGNVQISSAEGVKTYQVEDFQFSTAFAQRIEDEYPEAYKALTELYAKSVANTPYFRWLLVSRFIRCNFGVYDAKHDIDGQGRMILEDVSCPMRSECKYDNVICRAKYNNKLSARQTEVMKLYCQGYEYEEIGERLYISPATVKTIKRDAFRKVGAHDINEFRNLVEL